MNGLRWIEKGAMLVALLGTIFLGVYPAQAQDANLQVTPVQTQDPFAVKPVDFNNQADVLTLARLWDTADDMLGANLQPVSDALRAQLEIPPGQGLVVEGLRGDGACAQAGLQQNDILLALDNVSLGASNDLTKSLKAAGDSPIPLKILRGGKPVTIRVRPIYRVTLGPVGEQKTEYYIGISVIGLNDAMRAQLGIPEGKGMVVSEMEKGSPAEKAGVKKYDIVLALNDKPIDSPETLQQQVQAAQDRQVTLKILRAGKPVTVSVLAATRKVEANPNPGAYRLLFLKASTPYSAQPNYSGLPNSIQYLAGLENTAQPSLGAALVNIAQPSLGTVNTLQPGPVDSNDLRQRLDHLEKELAAVRATLDKINETLKANKGSKPD